MPITLNGAGTVSGISAGGLPDGIIQSADLASGVGGKILQVKTNTTRDSKGSLSLSSQNSVFDIPNISVNITPSSSSSKMLVSFHIMGENSADDASLFFVVRRAISGGASSLIRGTSTNNRTAIMTQATLVYYSSDTDSTPSFAQCSNYLDEPSTTSEITYAVQVGNNETTSTYYYNRTGNQTNASTREVGLSWITVVEVAA